MAKPTMRKVDGKWTYIEPNAPAPISLPRQSAEYTPETRRELWRVFLEDARDRGGSILSGDSGGTVYSPQTGRRLSAAAFGLFIAVGLFLALLVYQLLRS